MNDYVDLCAEYNRYYGNVEFFDFDVNMDRHYIYTRDEQSWYIDAWDLEHFKLMYNTSATKNTDLGLDSVYPGLSIRKNCHDFVVITYFSDHNVNPAPWRTW